MDTLENARKKIDEIDKQMAELFEKRMMAVEDVIIYKKQNNLATLDNNRETLVIQKNSQYIKDKKYLDSYIKFIRDVMDISKKYQRNFLNRDIVGYQGTKGAFSYIALKNIFKENKNRAYATFEDVFKAVSDGDIEYGVIPFENSYTGEVGENFDLLLKYDCYINMVYDLKINQNLIANKGASLKDIKQVYSHHQAIGQSQMFLKNFDFEVIPYPNTALAAEYVSKSGDISKAAIASEQTAEIYGLDVLVPNINTSAENTTRFIVISKNLIKEGNRFNLLFTVKHDAGQLAKIMQIIGTMGFNMESIKSRPLYNLAWQYYFYVEIVGDLKDEKTKELLVKLRENCKELKVLGAYNI